MKTSMLPILIGLMAVGALAQTRSDINRAGDDIIYSQGVATPSPEEASRRQSDTMDSAVLQRGEFILIRSSSGIMALRHGDIVMVTVTPASDPAAGYVKIRLRYPWTTLTYPNVERMEHVFYFRDRNQAKIFFDQLTAIGQALKQ